MKTLERLFLTALKRVVRNPYNSTGAVAVMFLTFFVGGAFVLISLGTNKILSYYESRPQIIAFFKDGTSLDQVNALKDSLNKTGKVASINYVDKNQALSVFKQRNQGNSAFTEFVSADTLPAYLEISTKKLEDQNQIAESAKADPQVEDVAYLKELIDNLTKWTSSLRLVGVVAITFLILTSIFVTLVVIGLNISLHKEEIEIMKLVGATERYIRTPFLFEGAFYGLLAAFISTLGAIGTIAWLSPFISKYLADFAIVPVPWMVFVYLLLGEGVVGLFVGTAGSFIATRKYLKV